MSARVYIAGPYQAREQLRGFRDQLTRVGVTVTSSWLDESHEVNSGTTGAATALDDDTVAGYAQTDLDDVRGSDVLLLFTSAFVGVEGGGGRHVETGYALAYGLPVVVVGEPENVFHRLGAPMTFRAVDWPHALAVLSRLTN